MVEYGNGISQGPAGQVSGGSGSGLGGGPVDLGATASHWVTGTVATLSALPPLELLAIAGAIVIGLMLLRRAL
jgi:hypothetical protein